MSKAISGLTGGAGSRKQKIQQAEARNDRIQAQQDRQADQARILNDRNAQLDGEVRAGSNGRRGRRQLAYRGREAGLRDKLGA